MNGFGSDPENTYLRWMAEQPPYSDMEKPPVRGHRIEGPDLCAICGKAWVRIPGSYCMECDATRYPQGFE